jgi:PAS domain S-box-containing protein
MCGYKTREEFATVSVLDYFKDSVDRENFLKRIARRPIKNFEAKINKKDGTSFWASISSFSYLNTSREKYYYLIIHDVNQRKEDIEELRLRAQILDATSDAIYLRQVNGPIVYMNGATEKIFGYTMDELNAIGLPQIITQDNKHLYKPRLKEIIEKGHAKFETVIERKDKSLYPVETTARLIKFKDENYILAISRDVSERKKNEAQNQTYNTKLQSLASDVFLAEEKERRRIATEVHDRTGQMLALCRIRLKNILEENLPQSVSDPLYEILSNIEKTIGEMRSLVFDLSSPLLYELGLEAALEQLLEEFESKFHIKCSLHAGNKPVALSEEVRVLLFQATRELVTNVIKHAKANNIDVNVRKRTDKVFVNVRDDGIGFKVDNSNNGTAKNEGFGIFSIRERLHYIGGNMRIISKQGRGTNVTISVPAV